MAKLFTGMGRATGLPAGFRIHTGFVLTVLNVFVGRASAASSSSSAEPSNPTAPNFMDDVTWLTAYLWIHSLSKNSYVYMYILWFTVGVVFFLLSWATWSGVRVTAIGAWWSKWALRRRTWRKKHTLQKMEAEAKRLGVPVSALHRQPRSLPSNAQILSAVALIVLTVVLCFVGPDYINPDLNLFQFSSSSSMKKRAQQQINDSTLFNFIAHYDIAKSWWTMAARFGGMAFALYPLVIVLALKAPPFALFGIPGLVAYGHDKMIRLHRYVGRLVWFVTLLHVIFWVVQTLKDRRAMTGKLVIAYVWQYQKFRFAWVAFISMTILMIFSLDCIRNPHYELFYFVHIVFTPMTIVFSALHHPARGVWGWCAAALALWVGERFWRLCWWVYVNGIFQVSNGSNQKGGRSTRRMGSLRPYTYQSPSEKEGNVVHRPAPSRGSAATLINPSGPLEMRKEQDEEQWEMNALPLRAPAPRRPTNGTEMDPYEGSDSHSRPASTASASTASIYTDTHADDPTPTPGELVELARVQTNSSSGGNARRMPLQIETGTPVPTPIYPPAALSKHGSAQSPGAGPGPKTSARHLAASHNSALSHRFHPQPPSKISHQSRYAPPPGFALATLLPGRTIRLRLVTPGYQTWAPGQHFLVGIPAVSRFTTHPFSVASVCDEQAALHVGPDALDDEAGDKGKQLVQTESGRELVLIVRAKKGWTKRLWDLVSSLQSQGLVSPPGESLPPDSRPPQDTGVVLRALVDGPFGSAGRTRWGRYASVLIVAGGSGVSFGLSILEYICLCIAGRDGRFLGGHPGGWGVGKTGSWITQRVRFVWLVREYAHIQWVVGSLRRCLTTIPTDALELNIFVTNFRPPQGLLTSPTSHFGGGSVDGHDDVTDDGLLKPPAPRFLSGGAGGGRNVSDGQRASISSDDSYASDISVDSIVDSYFDADTGNGKHDGEAADSVGELGHETHMLDYTNFDGDDDTPLPGENRLSRRIIKESKMRRARTRKAQKAAKAKQELNERVANAQARAEARGEPYAYAGHTKSPSEETYASGSSSKRLSSQSTAPLLPYASSSAYHDTHGQDISPVSPATSMYSAFSAFSAFDRHAYPQAHPRPRTPPSSFSVFGLPGASSNEDSPKSARRISTQSTSTIKSTVQSSMPSLTPTAATPGGVRWLDPSSPGGLDSKAGLESGSGLALDPQEVRDLQVVSEWARPGKPKLGRILADEVEASKGRIAVACCGPTSLNALMRKLVAEQISPGRVARGDLRGSIDFITEDFEY